MKTFPPPNNKQFRSVCPHPSTLGSFSFTFLISYHDPLSSTLMLLTITGLSRASSMVSSVLSNVTS